MAAQELTQQSAHTDSRRDRMAGRLRPFRAAVVPLALLLIWALADFILPSFVLASPLEAAAATVEGIRAGWLIEGLSSTLVVTVLGFLIAAVIGIWAGFVLGLSRFWGQVLEAPLLWVYAIPKVTLFPIFLLIFGLGAESRIAFGAFHGIFPLAIFVYNGITTIPKVYFKVAKVYQLSRIQVFSQVVLPSTLPMIVTGLRYCFSLTFLGIILAEMFASREGAGYELFHAISLNRLDRIFAIALSLVVAALVINSMLLWWEQWLRGRRAGGSTAQAQ